MTMQPLPLRRRAKRWVGLFTGLAVAALALVSGASASASEPTCGGLTATVIGTEARDFIRGTPGPDVIYAGGGNDSINGLGGDDRICAGTGHDRVIAGSGDDRVFAGGGNDSVEAGDGDDIVQGGAGNDRLWGQNDDDRLLGKAGDDVLRGGAGDDVVHADEGDDVLYGGTGMDVVRGGIGDDVAWGGGDADVLIGSAGADRLGGGDKNDNLRGGGGRDVINGSGGNDQIRGGNGNDTLTGGRGADYLDGGRDTDHCTDAGSRDSAICEGVAPPAGTFDCLPDGYTTAYQGGVVGSAFVADSGPRGPIVLIGDSLTSGSPIALASRLADIGYGPVCVDGVGSRRLQAAPGDNLGGLDAIARLRSVHPIWSSDATWIMALGTNDARYPAQLSLEQARAEVGSALEAIGPAGRDQWWINVRTTQARWQEREDIWNAGITAHTELGVIDWSSIATGRSDWFFDDVHPNATGHAHRLDLIATTLKATS